MNRIGVRHDEVVEFMGQVSFHRALDLVGTFTHFATADSAETLDFQIQVKRFIEPSRRCARQASTPASCMRRTRPRPSAILTCSSTWCASIAMYGLHPSGVTRPMIDLHPAMSVHARITDVRTVPMSEGVTTA